jgi:hypothetical protein
MVNDPSAPAPLHDALVNEAKRIEEDANHSAKGHFAAARPWGACNLWIGIPTTVGAALAGVSAISSYNVLAASLAILVAIGSGLATFLNPGQRATEHLKAGNAYNAIRNNARRFHQIDCQAPDRLDDLQHALKKLGAELDELNSHSPQIPPRAFARARKGIEDGESTYKVDQPRSLPPSTPS